MQDLWAKYAISRAPRYTSYPSALHFTDSVGQKELAAKLKTVPLYEPLSIYAHVPFCRQLCWYCGCNMRVENNYRRALDYVEALIGEVRLLGSYLNGSGRTANIHFGGGSPNYLSPDDLGCILAAIELELGLTDDARLAIELDPRLVREGDIAQLVGHGFSRMSLGVQDFDPDVQKAINRVQSFEMIEACVSDMRQAGVNDVSFDLLYGLPKQTTRSFAATVAKTIALAPDRLSIFGYAHLPSAIRRQRLINESDLPDDALRRDLAAIADDALTAAGYQQVGFDHYARPDNPLAAAARAGRLKRNFQGFTDDVAETMISVGATAISFVDGLYVQNEKDVRAYCDAIAAGRLPARKGVERTPRDWTAAETINRLLCDFETDLTPLFSVLSPQEAAATRASLEELERDGLIRREAAMISIPDCAKALSRAVAAAIDPYAYTAKPLAQAV